MRDGVNSLKSAASNVALVLAVAWVAFCIWAATSLLG